MAPTAGIEPANPGLEVRCLIQSALWVKKCGRTGETRTRIPMDSSGLSRGRLPIAPPSVTWCEAPDLNRETTSFELARYTISHQLRIAGAFPEARTRNICILSAVRLPIAPGRLIWCPNRDSNPKKTTTSTWRVYQFHHRGKMNI